MRWQGQAESNNVEDRRGQGSGKSPFGGSRILILLVVLVAGYYGIDLTPLLSNTGADITSSRSYTPSAQENEAAQFTSIVLKSTEDTWEDTFQKMGTAYAPPKLVLYTGVTQTTCGYGQAAMGPFYCPADQTIYIDLAFYQDMKDKMGGGGDFAQGYVVAHEVGHHVQHLLGIDQKVRQMQSRSSETQANQLSVKMELQADCFAGIWGKAMENKGILDPGDLEQALATAEAIGDDRLQKQTSGRVVPDSFTHGTSKQRYTWFKRGFDSGSVAMCDTFSNAQ